MITCIIIFLATYSGLYQYLPVFRDSIYQDDYVAQAARQLILLYLTNQLTGFIWRQRFIPKLRVSSQKHAVMITGCDTGFGNLLTRKLDRNGFKVYACCLFPEAENAKQLQADCSALLQIVKLNVTKDADVDEAYTKVERDLERSGYQLLAVVNNAGILATGEVEFGHNIEPFQRQMEVNCMGTVRVTRAFMPLLRRCQSSPRLVNVTSLAARICLPGMVGYCMSKCAALSFTDGVRVELQKWNVKVVSVEPHLFRTNLIAVEAQHQALRRLWDSSRPVTRQDYGESFFEGAKRLLDHGISTGRTNIPDVVQTMYDSVTVKHPETHPRIFSSELERLRFWFLARIMPRWLQDGLLHLVAAYVTGPPEAKAKRAL